MPNILRKIRQVQQRLFSSRSSSSYSSPCQFRTDKRWLDLNFNEDDQIRKPNELENEMLEPNGLIDDKLLDRVYGCLTGLAVGDALGAHVEFRPHDYLLAHPVRDLEGGGTWGLSRGQFTDDTSMALCLAISLVTRCGFVPYDQLVRYKWWYKHGYMSSIGNCFDIGGATSESLEEFIRRQKEFAKKKNISIERLDSLSDPALLRKFPVHCSRSGAAGNGALMRLAPVPLFFHRHEVDAVEYSGISGQITHGDVKAYDACRYYGALIVAALKGEEKTKLLDDHFYEEHKSWFNNKPLCAEIQKIAAGSYKRKDGYDDGIRGKGYIVDALEAALWAFWSDGGSFKKGALAAVNLGDDTDTTAAIYGQLAGAYYGYRRLPENWKRDVFANGFISNLSKWIVYEGEKWQTSQNSALNREYINSHISSSSTRYHSLDNIAHDHASTVNDIEHYQTDSTEPPQSRKRFFKGQHASASAMSAYKYSINTNEQLSKEPKSPTNRKSRSRNRQA